jgi:DeoR/GlpR family transcriptional regulator of sugar metabolism
VDRRHGILARVAEEQTIRVSELAAQFDVSEMTIRRDISRLERDGFLRQTYGGATAHLTRSFDLAFNARALERTREKRLIGMRATSLIAGARTIFVGIGTTAEQFARYLPASTDLNVVTASLPTASLLGTRPLRVVALGGRVLRDELTCVGGPALATLERYRFDVAIVGAAGFSARWGLTELNEAEAEVQRAALARSARVVVIADASKIGTATSIVVGPATLVETLVTDRSASADEVAALRALGLEVIIVGQDASRATPIDRVAGAAGLEPAAGAAGAAGG